MCIRDSTTTSGSPAGGPDGVFDSGITMPGTSFSQTFDDLGVYDYFCMVHPWMTGKVTVSGNAVQTQPEPQVEEEVEEPITITVDTTPIETNVINISSLADTPSCDDTKTCLDPYHAQISVNQNVTWGYTPFARHIVSGNTTYGPDGLFDFGLIHFGENTNGFQVFNFNQTGTYQFFDMIHPWIAGNITVTGGN